jgi:hydroxyacylglutathione hydrolase
MLAAALRRVVGVTAVQLNRRSIAMDVYTIPALSDNYMYIIVDRSSRQAAVVDPVEPEAVLSKLYELKVDFKLLLTTHHHWDHAGGNEELIKRWAGEPPKVLGGDKRVPGLTNQVEQDDEFMLGSIVIQCLHTPCHTTGHICYFMDDEDGEPAVFTGTASRSLSFILINFNILSI